MATSMNDLMAGMTIGLISIYVIGLIVFIGIYYLVYKYLNKTLGMPILPYIVIVVALNVIGDMIDFSYLALIVLAALSGYGYYKSKGGSALNAASKNTAPKNAAPKNAVAATKNATTK